MSVRTEFVGGPRDGELLVLPSVPFEYRVPIYLHPFAMMQDGPPMHKVPICYDLYRPQQWRKTGEWCLRYVERVLET